MNPPAINYLRIFVISFLLLCIIISPETINAKPAKLLTPAAWEQAAQDGDTYYQALLGASYKNGYLYWIVQRL